MFYVILLLGLALWWGAHLFKPMFPEKRAAFSAKHGDKKARGIMAVVILFSVLLMGVGYAHAEWIDVWYPPTFFTHINNLLMLFAIALLGAGDSKSNLRRVVRHPMLIGTKTWALAHLMVNGDLASVILFGGILGWAVLAMIQLNKRDGEWVKPPKSPITRDIGLAVATIVLYGVIVWVHIWAGVSPVPG
ncbi:NnrU family protein [Rhodovulum sp. DZ06]|uniref:NnrU family protein n=1 Tax=Rhodovulum sp. DZ06 TaxID=3425126 RepID=UPI003D33B09D